MPITSPNLKACPHDSKQTGFTLIEVMVVLLIIAIVTAIAVLTLDVSGSRQTQIDLLQFASKLLFSKQQAINLGQPLQMRFTPYGYKMYTYKVDNITFLLNKPLQGEWLSYADGLYDKPKAFNLKFTVTSLVNKKNKLAAIMILPNGYITPFILTLATSGGIAHQLKFDAQGTKL